MGDYEGTPSKWDWSAATTEPDLKTELTNSGSRLISVHRPDGGASVPFTAVWIANKGADKATWNWSPGSTGAQLDSLVKKDKGRLIHVDAYTLTGTGVQIAGIWVANTGKFHEEWGWDPALTGAQLQAKVGRAQRIISLSTYRVGARRLYAAVWVKNTGAKHRDWGWSPSTSFEELRQSLEDLPGRLVSIDAFVSGADLRFAAAWVDAEDAFAKLWWWGVGQNEDEIEMDIPLFCSYMVEARTLPGAQDHFAHFRHGFPRSAYKESAPLVELSGSAALTDLKPGSAGYFEQDSSLDLHLKSIASDPVDLVEAELIRTYHDWFWWESRVMKMLDSGQIFGGKPAQMAPGADYHGTWLDLEWGLTHDIARVRATGSGGAAQRTALSIPIERSGFTPVAATEATVPVWLGMWANPWDIVPLILEGKNVRWLMIGGEIVNWTGETLLVGGLHVTVLTPGGTIVVDRECTYDFRKHHYSDWPAVPPSTVAHAELPDAYSVFVDGIEIPKAVDVSGGLTVRLVLNYKLPDGWCGAASREDQATYLETPLMLSPVRGSWHFGNGPTQVGFSPHAQFHERYSYDLTQRDDNGATYSGDEDDNNSFYCYGENVHAMADGVVLGCVYTNVENEGLTNPDEVLSAAANEVVLGHDGGPLYPRRSRYVHLQPKAPDSPSNPGQPLAVGDAVSAGDVVGFVGNSGHSSEPHLHCDLWGVDPSGRPRPWPMRFSDLRAVRGKRAMNGTPTTGDYETV